MAAQMIVRTSSPTLLKGVLLLVSMLTVMAGATVSPALPAMQRNFSHVVDVELLVRLVLTLPALFIVISAPVSGYIIDRLGRKPLLLVGITLYGAAGMSGAYAPDLMTILIGRAFLGLAVAGIMTCVTTLVADYYVGLARSQMLGIQAAFMGLGGVVFVMLGGVLSDVHWRAPFLIYGCAFLLLPLVMAVIYEPKREVHLTKTDEGIGIDLPPLGLVVAIYLIVLLVQLAFTIIPLQLTYYLEQLVNADGGQKGLAVAFPALFYAAGSALFGRIDGRWSRLAFLAFGFSTTGVGFLLMSRAVDWVFILAGLPLIGFGIGFIMPNMSVWLANISPLALRGRLMGGYAMAVFFGQFISPFVTQPMVNTFEIPGTYLLIGVMLLVLGVVMVGGTWLNRQKR